MFPDGPTGSHDHGSEWHVHDNSQTHGFISRDEFSIEEKMNIHMCVMWWGQDCDQILDPANRMTYQDAIQEQCDLMPGMQVCDDYLWSTSTTITHPFDLAANQSAPLARQPDMVVLQDWDTYTMEITEVRKVINGQELRMLAYNWSIPWPILKAPQGSSITLTVINRVDDIVTTVHHHGLRLDHTQDGVPREMWWYDDPIWSWGELTYTLTFPDDGVFWYHPHVREDLQQELGLYGNYLIMSSQHAPVNREQTIMLDDIFLDMHGEMIPFDTTKGTHVVMGRYGNTSLINGDTDYTLEMKTWEVIRLYLTNVANVTPFNLSISDSVFSSTQVDTSDHPQMKLVWWDIGWYEREEMIDNLVIAPAERYIVDLYAPAPGVYQIINQVASKPYVIATLVVSQDQAAPSYASDFSILHDNITVTSDIDRFRSYFDKAIDKTLVLDVEMDGMMWGMWWWHGMMMWHGWHGDSDGHDVIALPGWLSLDPSTVEWSDTMPMMNQVSTTDNTRRHLVDKDTGKRDMDIHRSFDQWDVVKVRIYNDPDSVHPMQHPIHFHGQRFLVLNKNGVDNQNLVWKDTILVPTGEYVDILIDMSNPGKRMAHCHIAEHLTAGMMMNFEVKD